MSKSDDLGVREGLPDAERRGRPNLISTSDSRHQPVELELDYPSKAGPHLKVVRTAADDCGRSDDFHSWTRPLLPISALRTIRSPQRTLRALGQQPAVAI